MSEIVDAPALPADAPLINPETAPFWEATLEGRLLISRCRQCNEPIWYPRGICPFCHSTDVALEQSSGRGTVYTFTVIRRVNGPWSEVTPYVLAYVELDEGPRMMTNIVDCDPESVTVGMAVEVVFHRTGDTGALARFRPI